MVIIHGGKIINCCVPVEKISKVLVQRKTKYSREWYTNLPVDELELVVHYRNNVKNKPDTWYSNDSLYDWKRIDLFPGDIIKHNDLSITVEDIHAMSGEANKAFYCQKLTSALETQVMLEKNLK